MAIAPDVLAALSTADVEYAYLGTKGATGLGLADRRVQVYTPDRYTYFAGLSGLSPAQNYTLADHQYAYYRAQSGFDGTINDCARIFWMLRLDQHTGDLMADVKIVVRHWLNFGDHHRTVLTVPIPENIDPDNVDDFLAAMVEHAAALHQQEHFGKPEQALVEAVRRQVLTGILNDALEGPGRRLAERALAVLSLDDEQVLDIGRHPRRGGRDSG